MTTIGYGPGSAYNAKVLGSDMRYAGQCSLRIAFGAAIVLAILAAMAGAALAGIVCMAGRRVVAIWEQQRMKRGIETPSLSR